MCGCGGGFLTPYQLFLDHDLVDLLLLFLDWGLVSSFQEGVLINSELQVAFPNAKCK